MQRFASFVWTVVALTAGAMCGAVVSAATPGPADDPVGVYSGPARLTDRAGETCPPQTLAGQDMTGGTWFYSDEQRCQSCTQGTCCSRVRCENYPPAGVTITRPIGMVSWQGVFLDQTTSNGGVTKPPRFHVAFYPDDGGQPDRDHPFYTETVLCEQLDTGTNVLFTGGTVPAEVYQFTAVLAVPVNLPTGWFSVQGAAADPPNQIAHLWGPSNQGDLKLAQWFRNPLTPVEVSAGTDLNYCLQEKRMGACCFCHECRMLSELECANQGGFFFLNQPCAQVQPPCEQQTGACCHPDGSCTLTTCGECAAPWACAGDCNCDGFVNFDDINSFVAVLGGATPCAFRACDVNGDGVIDFDDINPFVALLAAGGGPCDRSLWLGPGSECGSCPPIVICPPGGVHEHEPLCGPEYVDHTNGGCTSSPPVWGTIQCDETVCGKSGTFVRQGNPARDSDWYRWSNAYQSVSFRVEAIAEFPLQVQVLGGGSCDPNDIAHYYYTIQTANVPAYTPLSLVTRWLNAGEYWFVVQPQVFSGVPCGADYTLTVHCDMGPPCPPIDPPPGCHWECEPCTYGGDTCNGGCNVTPNQFEDVTFDPNETADLCGTLWAKDGMRDLDWYRFTIDSPKLVEVWWEAEFPGACGIVTGAENGRTGAPTCADGIWSCGPFDCGTFTLCNFGVLPAGYYWPVALIEDANGAIFDGFPCGVQNTYHIRLRAYVPNCPNLITCTGGPPWGPRENEPDCGSGYVDTFNGGCDNTAALHFLPVVCDAHLCAKSGTWVNNGTPMMDTDWYQITATEGTQYVVSVVAEFPLEFQVWKPGDGNSCTGALLLEEYQVADCQTHYQDIPLIHCLRPGNYWLRFSPQNAQIPMPCGANALNYSFWISGCNACAPCLAPCPPGSVQEGEPCGDDTNGGCDDSPAKFAPADCNTTICGTTWARGGQRDTDWYRITRGGTTNFRFDLTADTEVPLVVVVVTGTVAGHPSCSDQAGYMETGIVCNNSAGTHFVIPPTGTFPPGEYWIVVAPADAAGNPIFENYPCGGGLNNYWLRLLCE